MKTPCSTRLALWTACLVLPASGLFAQSAAPEATPSVSAPAKSAASAEADDNEGGMRARAMSVLTPEERQKLRAANKAAKQDPSVKALEASRDTDKRGYRKAVRAAMVRIDPSVEPILEKLKEARPHKNKLKD